MPAPRLGRYINRLFKAVIGRETRALPQPFQQMLQGWGGSALFKPEESLEAYDYNVWLYRAVLNLAMELARVKIRLRFKTSSGEYKFIESHQSLDLLARPQTTKYGKVQLTGMMLKVITFMHQLLNGEAFWVALKRLPPNLGGAPTMLDLALPQYMREVLDSDGEIKEYVYQVPTSSGNVLHLPPSDVFHFRIPDPKNWLRGHSPVQSIRYAVDTHRKADEMNTTKLGNNGVPPGVLESEQAIAEADRKKLSQQWQSTVGGINAGKVPVMPQGLKFNKIQDSNQEMQYVEGKNVSRDEILANYGMPLEIIGQTDSVTRANAEASIFVFQRFGVLPFLELFVDALTNDFLVAFPNPKDAEFWFDDPVPANNEEKRLNAERLFASAGMTPDEMRREFGREPLNIAGVTDVPYIGYSMVRADQEATAPPVPLGL